MKAIVSEKGQVTIPKPVRERLGLRSGVAMEFFEENGRLIGCKVETADPVSAVTGIIKLVKVDEYLDKVRGPAV